MAGRPSKPTELILLERKSHRTKAELDQRKKAEKALYTGEHFLETKQVKGNEIAHKEFIRLKRLYSKITYVDALDQQVINRYCLEVANIHNMQNKLQQLDDLYDELKDEPIMRLQIIEQSTKITMAIAKSKDLLLKYEDRLFLNPASRIKSIPKKVQDEAPKTGMAAFRQKRTDSM